MKNLRVLLDSCILYPAPLRDLLMRLSTNGLFKAKWTDQIHEEWIGNVLRNRKDLSREQLEKTKNLMNTHAEDALVTDYEELIEKIILTDKNDRHVVAAAIKGKATIIVTYNLKDFPKNILSEYNIETQHPDEFLMSLMNLSIQQVLKTVYEHRAALKKPPKSTSEYLSTLSKQSLPQTVTRLNEWSDFI